MLPVERRWVVPQRQPALEEEIARSLGTSRVMAQVLINRGLTETETAELFLSGKKDAPFPPLSGLEAAAARILAAARRKERVLVYGDYDVDGITATVLLRSALEELGIDTGYYIPDRLNEGYGLNREAVARAAKQGYRVIVTVDCGISSHEEVELARTLGVDVVITDHHDPPEELPPACAVVNPKLDQADSQLAGVGVAYRLACSLLEAAKGTQYSYCAGEYLDLVALGTVADVVPLLGENRLLVREGLKRIAAADRPGLRELLRAINLLNREIEPWHIGFILGPRLNAAGRMGNAEAAVRLLITESPTEAAELVEALEAANRERQDWEKRIIDEAEAIICSNPEISSAPALVLLGDEWHPGVIGIVASRLVEKYNRPVILFARDGERGIGSGRSVPGFSLIQALRECGGYLEEFGGHDQAAGMTVLVERLADFAGEFVKTAGRELSQNLSEPELRIDAVTEAEDLCCDLLAELNRLKPFGQGNPAPLLLLEGSEVSGCQVVGSGGEHLKLRLNGSGEYLEAIAFRQATAAEAARIRPGVRIDLAFQLEDNTWQGRSRLQLKVREFRGSPITLPGWEEIAAAAERRECCVLVQSLPLWVEEFWERFTPALIAARLKALPALSHRDPVDQRRFWEAFQGEGFDLVLTTADYLTYYVEKFCGSRRKIGLLLIDRDPDETEMPDLSVVIEALGQPRVRTDSYLLRFLGTQTGEDAWRKRQWSFPHRDHLAEVYRYLRYKGKTGGWTAIDKPEVSQWWKRRRPHENPDLDQLLPASLYILEETSLLSARVDQRGMEFGLNPSPPKKVDLNTSLRYREGQRMRRFYRTE